MPPTRYQGSKRKLAPAIVEAARALGAVTVLDAFSGTGSVAYAFKRAGYAVTYNDNLAFNHQIGRALIENDRVRLRLEEVEQIGSSRSGRAYGDVIQRNFGGVYFTDEENRWLDVAIGNVSALRGKYRRAIAWYALCQSAMAKRPYNLFHRKNLYMRTATVRRGFGNKTTWDRSFDDHVRRFTQQANAALIDSGGTCRATRGDALEVDGDFDLVYIDTPYINSRGIGVDYHHYYHFLEGMVQYHKWEKLIDTSSKHRRLFMEQSAWLDPGRVHAQFTALFDRFRSSTLMVSYRSDGIPTVRQLARMLRDVKPRVWIVNAAAYQYALSTNRSSREVLLIASG